MSSSGWCTIESDPSIIHSLLHSFGCKNMSASEVYALDPDSFVQALVDGDGVETRGLVFLFKWEGGGVTVGEKRKAVGDPNVGTSSVYPREITDHSEIAASGVFFANQTIQNACCR